MERKVTIFMINTVIVDDQPIVREGLKMILSLYEDINIMGEAENGKELLNFLKHDVPDVILMDIRMPVMDGIEATKEVKETYPSVKVIILTTFNEDEYIFTGLKYGADGYILKDADSKEIIHSMKAAYTGEMLLNPKIAAKVVKALNLSEDKKTIPNKKKDNNLNLLTPRENEVARYVMEGKSNKSIGKEIFVTEGTVKNYVSSILEKLELNSRTELVIYMKDNCI